TPPGPTSCGPPSPGWARPWAMGASPAWPGSALRYGTRPSTAPATPAPARPDPTRTAFRAWWSAESQYSLTLDLYQPQDTNGLEDREAALRLAALRWRADSRRDTYFRAALT
ncbi:MAG: hypothetical protein WCF36_05185, partial [Candidatus Nanopelagicales bacterium]